MAVPLWLQSGTYPASADRRLLGALWPGPAVTGLAVTAVGGQMRVSVAPGQAAVPTQNNSGSTLCTSDAAVQVGPLANAPGTGSSRIDLIIVRPRGADLDGGANNDYIFDFVTGNAAASPVAPALPAGTLLLAQVAVGANVAALVQANITDMRPFGLSIGGATALPPPLGAGAPIASYTDGEGDVWVAKGGVNGGAWKKARDVLMAHWARAAAYTLATTGTTYAYDVLVRDTYGLYNGSAWVAPIAGMYEVRAQIQVTPTAAGQWISSRIFLNASQLVQYNAHTSLAAQCSATAATLYYLNVGDTLTTIGAASASLAAATGQQIHFGDFAYRGNG